MTLELPPAGGPVSARSSVAMTICQVHFEQSAVVGESNTAVAFQSHLGGPDGPYPKVQEAEAVNQVTLSVGPGGPVPETKRTNGWSLRSDDEAWTIALLPNSVGLQTNQYDGWDDFATRLAKTIEALVKVVAPAFEQRLGLRCVDRIQGLGVDSPQAWAPYVTPHFLGPILEPGLGPAVRAAHQQLIIDPGDDAICNLRHGPSQPNEDGSCDYIVDCDLFREGGRTFDAAAVMRTAKDFKDHADRLFQAAATPALLDRIRR
jgi:uncharacterized protein (TIGR04255 family)